MYFHLKTSWCISKKVLQSQFLLSIRRTFPQKLSKNNWAYRHPFWNYNQNPSCFFPVCNVLHLENERQNYIALAASPHKFQQQHNSSTLFFRVKSTVDTANRYGTSEVNIAHWSLPALLCAKPSLHIKWDIIFKLILSFFSGLELHL